MMEHSNKTIFCQIDWDQKKSPECSEFQRQGAFSVGDTIFQKDIIQGTLVRTDIKVLLW